MNGRISHRAQTQDNTRDEWKDKYIDYKGLKKALKPLKAGAKSKKSMVGGGGGEASDSGVCAYVSVFMIVRYV